MRLASFLLGFVESVPDRIRTCDLPIRNRTIYPADLRGHMTLSVSSVSSVSFADILEDRCSHGDQNDRKGDQERDVNGMPYHVGDYIKHKFLPSKRKKHSRRESNPLPLSENQGS